MYRIMRSALSHSNRSWMKVVVLSPTFSPDMGYFGNMYPKHLARSGVDVHVITTNLPHNWQLPEFAETYGAVTTRSPFPPGTRVRYDGYQLHVLPHRRWLGQTMFVGLAALLARLGPSVVQTLTAIGHLPMEAAHAQSRFGFALFTGSHTAASTFPLAHVHRPFLRSDGIRVALSRRIPGRWVSRKTIKCYTPTIDCAEIARRFFGVEASKIEVMHLGVETDIFHPVRNDEDAALRMSVRRRLGFAPDDVVFIYTGKLTHVKNPLILARAVARMRARGLPATSLVIGEGPQARELGRIDGCTVLPFMRHQDLPLYYRASDVGVWPTNESTSMLDAAACGLPLVVSTGIVYREHVEGNGLVVPLGDEDALVATLAELLDAERRSHLGIRSARKMQERFGWDSVVRRRVADYEAALAGIGRTVRTAAVAL